MGEPLTADDVLALVARLSPIERARLLRRILAGGNDAEAYRAAAPPADEFSSDKDSLAWEGEGWENVK